MKIIFRLNRVALLLVMLFASTTYGHAEELSAEELSAEELTIDEFAEEVIAEVSEIAEDKKVWETRVMESTLGTIPEFDYRDFTSPIGYFVAHNTDSVELAHFKEKPRRVDRGINRHKFIFSGEKVLGISFAYISLNSTNSDFLLMLTDVTASGSLSSIKPFFGYFYRDNRAIGARFTYTGGAAELKTSSIDLGESNGIFMDIPYVSATYNNYEYALFHRAYAALGKSGHFGLFAEIELAASHGKSIFAIEDGDRNLSSIESRNRTVNLNFNPGMTAFIFHNVSASVSFGLGGFKYSKVDQYNEDGIYIGDRTASNMRFSLNLLAINFGITMHLWSQKELKFKE